MLLNCHTYYSFCYGTFNIEELLKLIKQNDYIAFALTDINNTSACLNTIRLSAEAGLKVVPGIDFRNGVKQQYIGIACNNEGFRELNEHLSRHLHQAEDFEAEAPGFSHAYVIYPLAAYKGQSLRENEFVGISIRDLQQLSFRQLKLPPEKLVALQPATFSSKRQYNAHRLLRAIDRNMLLSKLPLSEQAEGWEMMMPKAGLQAAYAAHAYLLVNANRLLASCHVHFDYGKFANKNMSNYIGDAAADIQLLRSECEKGLHYRYGQPSLEVMQRLTKELDVIGQMNFASYFLINWDIIRYAQHKNYYYVGRGSGANSIVAYLLRITDVDPIELDLYFERFINPYRSNPPDFDIDFSWTDRDDITRYIFEHFDQMGNKCSRTALLGSYNTFQHDAVIRELGKVFGLPPGEIDRLQRADRYPDIDEMGQKLLRYSKLIGKFPSHLSIHSSGILISEEPITYYSATSMPPKGYPTTQFSMLEAEDIGLYKFDILSQRGLGKIKDALQLVKENKEVEVDIHQVELFKQDEKVKVLLREARAIGCFYVESPAMRMLLAKLACDDYLRLVAASSIIRPGVAKSGMMREYIVRYRDEKARTKAREQLPELYDLLAETYGVMVYQEDVIKVAHFFAGLSLAEADYLRRGMSWKFRERNEFWRVKENFFKNCREKGHPDKLVGDIWMQIESFGNYAFSKGHSASYAVESYQAMYLKAHYPLEYMVATLNNGGGFYRQELYIHEARMHGATICPPCMNRSRMLCSISAHVIHLGLAMISGLDHQTAADILQEREANGPFQDIYDFIKRFPIAIGQMRLLVRAGCFDFMGRDKKELLWEVHAILQPVQKLPTRELFENRPKKFKLPKLSNSSTDEAFEQMELLGFPLCSPFDLLRDPLPDTLTARDLPASIGKTVIVAAYLVTTKPTGTGKGERMCFGTFLDREGHWIDTIHFPPSLKKYPFNGGGCYLLRGKVTEEYDFVTIDVDAMKRLPVIDREMMREDTAEETISSQGNSPLLQAL